MTTFNSAKFIHETINSILTQSFSDFTLLILDDGSKDDTCDKIAQIKDPRIRFYSFSENLGVGARLKQALELVETPYIAKVDSDDISLPSRFQDQLRYLEDNNGTDIVKSYFEYFSTDREVLQSKRFYDFKLNKESLHNSIKSSGDISDTLLRWNCVMHTTYFARSEVIKRLGYEPVRVGEDYSLFYRANLAGIKIGCVPKTLVRMRLSKSSVTTNTDSAFHFASVLFTLKRCALNNLQLRHEVLWIYGTGALARAFLKVAKKNGVNFYGFLDQKIGALDVAGITYPVKSLGCCIKGGVVLAAQPARARVVRELEENGFNEWVDYLVLA